MHAHQHNTHLFAGCLHGTRPLVSFSPPDGRDKEHDSNMTQKFSPKTNGTRSMTRTRHKHSLPTKGDTKHDTNRTQASSPQPRVKGPAIPLNRPERATKTKRSSVTEREKHTKHNNTCCKRHTPHSTTNHITGTGTFIWLKDPITLYEMHRANQRTKHGKRKRNQEQTKLWTHVKRHTPHSTPTT